MAAPTSQIEAALPALDSPMRRRLGCGDEKVSICNFPVFSILTANASSQWMWHGAFPWVYSHAESSWWYMKAGTDGKFLAWKQSDKKWYSFDEVGKAWVVLSGQGDVQEGQDLAANKAGDTFTIPYLSLEMLWVVPGTFTMGSDDWRYPHLVTLSEGYWLGKHEVTQSQWERVMGSNPSQFKGADRPVEKVKWTDVTAFCGKLTELEREAGRLPAGMAYQLPTDAQWEYACRAGTKTAFSFGDELTAIHANFDENWGSTTVVGKYPANAWGFHDMHGNVMEWCADWWSYPIPSGLVHDPVGPTVGRERVSRGGSWFIAKRDALSASRLSYYLDRSRPDLGFRLSLRPASK
jgi:formylglycine-generating enzyme required for sulfatase activity